MSWRYDGKGSSKDLLSQPHPFPLHMRSLRLGGENILVEGECEVSLHSVRAVKELRNYNSEC